jgi:hypothetical protein
MSPITSILYKLKLFWKNFNKLSEATEQPIEDTYLSVYDAPNPSEINWENFGTNFRKMVTVRICSSFYLLKCLFVSYFILATTVFLRKNVTEYFYYVSPFTIAITNIWIEKCSLEYTKYEKLRNSTKEA